MRSRTLLKARYVVLGSALCGALAPGTGGVYGLARAVGAEASAVTIAAYELPARCVANAVVVQADGKVIAAGNIDKGPWGQPNYHWAIERYNNDGTLDKTFGDNGQIVSSFGYLSDTIKAMALQSDGKIVVAGQVQSKHLALGRFNSDGSPDATFGKDGLLLPFAPKDIKAHSKDSSLFSVIIQNDGKILVSGVYRDSRLEFVSLLARFNSDGSYDMDFGTTGNASPLPLGLVRLLAVQADGKIWADGFQKLKRFAPSLLRLNSDGTLDKSFGEDGALSFPGSLLPQAIFPLKNGQLLVAPGQFTLPVVPGQFTINDPEGLSVRYGLRRYSSGGTQDMAFGANGELVLPTSLTVYKQSPVPMPAHLIEPEDVARPLYKLIPYNDPQPFDVSLQADEKIIVSSRVLRDTANAALISQEPARTQKLPGSFVVRRFNSDGTPDTSFGKDGVLNATYTYTYNENPTQTATSYILAIRLNRKLIALDKNWKPANPNQFEGWEIWDGRRGMRDRDK